MADVSFAVGANDARLISKCVLRAKGMNKHVDTLSLTMDLRACHANGTPIDFSRLYAADDFNFAHDVFGIIRHMDRETGKLSGFFRPRFSSRVEASHA